MDFISFFPTLNGGNQMENKYRGKLRPLNERERAFASENYNLITRFLMMSKVDIEEMFDIVVFDFLLSVEIYLNNEELQSKHPFEAVSYMYMRRALFLHFREQKAQKRSSEAGADVSLNEMDSYIESPTSSMENISTLEYEETLNQIEEMLTQEQRKIFSGKLDGYSLKEIANNNGIKEKRVYKQFGKIKGIVSDVMEEQRKFG